MMTVVCPAYVRDKIRRAGNRTGDGGVVYPLLPAVALADQDFIFGAGGRSRSEVVRRSEEPRPTFPRPTLRSARDLVSLDRRRGGGYSRSGVAQVSATTMS